MLPTGSSSSYYLVPVPAKKCLSLPNRLPSLTNGLGWATQLLLLLLRRKKQAFTGSRLFNADNFRKEWELYVKISWLSSFKTNCIQSLTAFRLEGVEKLDRKSIGWVFPLRYFHLAANYPLEYTAYSEWKSKAWVKGPSAVWNSCERNPSFLSSQFITKNTA